MSRNTESARASNAEDVNALVADSIHPDLPEPAAP